jgi:N-acetylglucosaminyldiphosphoundecaprenol N-acetyl-beta-D-mannosaminyltransferase
VADIAKADLFGVGVSVTTYEEASAVIIDAAKRKASLGVTALATHGLMMAVDDPELRGRVNQLDIVTPDGQPVRWALNSLHRAGLRDRVYGPDLARAVCAAAEREGLSVYLFGSTEQTCQAMVAELGRRYPRLQVADVQPDRFREATPEEDAGDVNRMNDSGAGVVLVGRGCPRQERWVADHLGRVHAPMLGVGAAFDYFAGNLKRPPAWMQRAGLEWLYRLAQEPRRLFRRYVVYNTKFLLRLGRSLIALRIRGAGPAGTGS